MKTRATTNGLPQAGTRDSRTLLLGRDSFYNDVDPLIASAESELKSLVLVVVDVDGLDVILRTFGPEERDNAIRQIGHRIQMATQSDSIPYHITQDRFAIVLPEMTDTHVIPRAKALIESLKSPLQVPDTAYQLDAFIGISHYPTHARTLSDLVRSSVFACNQARKSDRGYAIFDAKTDELAHYRFRLLADLQQALETQTGIQLAYQPQVNLSTDRCLGLEALCRWEHPSLGQITPGSLLPLVEGTQLIVPLSEVILDLGLKQMSAWQARGFEGRLAINLSPVLFRQPDILDRLLALIKSSGVAPEAVDFEITETGIMDQWDRATEVLADIRRRKSRVAIDDFGTGHSSLAYLADLPADVIKIDKHFVQNLSQRWGEAIVSASATLADKLSLSTVAEGIEDADQFAQCRELGVDAGQGFYIARPMFPEDLSHWLANRM